MLPNGDLIVLLARRSISRLDWSGKTPLGAEAPGAPRLLLHARTGTSRPSCTRRSSCRRSATGRSRATPSRASRRTGRSRRSGISTSTGASSRGGARPEALTSVVGERRADDDWSHSNTIEVIAETPDVSLDRGLPPGEHPLLREEPRLRRGHRRALGRDRLGLGAGRARPSRISRAFFRTGTSSSSTTGSSGSGAAWSSTTRSRPRSCGSTGRSAPRTSSRWAGDPVRGCRTGTCSSRTPRTAACSRSPRTGEPSGRSSIRTGHTRSAAPSTGRVDTRRRSCRPFSGRTSALSG